MEDQEHAGSADASASYRRLITPSMIRAIVRNPLYRGALRVTRTGSAKPNAEDDSARYDEYPGRHTPLVTEPVWFAANNSASMHEVRRAPRAARQISDGSSLQQHARNEKAVSTWTDQLQDLIQQFEKEVRRARMLDARRRAAKMGEWPAGAASFGYSYQAGSRVPVVDENEAKTVRYIFEQAAGGMTISEIAVSLKQLGIYGRPGTSRSNGR